MKQFFTTSAFICAAVIMFIGCSSPESKPDKVTGVYVVSKTTNSVTLGWDVMPDTESYVIDGATINGGPYSTTGVGSITNTATVIGLVTATTYYFVVPGFNSAGLGDPSDQLAVTTN